MSRITASPIRTVSPAQGAKVDAAHHDVPPQRLRRHFIEPGQCCNYRQMLGLDQRHCPLAGPWMMIAFEPGFCHLDCLNALNRRQPRGPQPDPLHAARPGMPPHQLADGAGFEVGGGVQVYDLRQLFMQTASGP